MEILLVIGALVLFVGSIKGYRADSRAARAEKNFEILRRKVEGLERKLDGLGTDVDTVARVEPIVEVNEASSKEADVGDALASDSATASSIPVDVHELSVMMENSSGPVSLQSGSVGETVPVEPHEEERSEIVVSGLPKVLQDWSASFRGMNWETFVGTYLIRVIGVILVTIAVFIGLAQVVQNTGPGVRVFMGYCVSIGLLIGGRFAERKHPGYARVVYAGGLSIAYFVTFATHYIPLARIFDHPLPSLFGMAFIVGVWAVIAQRRRSPAIALLVTLLGHFTIALTTFTVDNPGLYSVFGVVILSLGSAFFLLRNRWYYIAAVGMVASYLNHFVVLARSEGSDTVAEFTLGMVIMGVYLLIFALAEMFSSESLRRGSVPNWFRSVFVALNTACFFGLGSLLVEGYSFSEDFHHVFRYGLAITMLVFAILYYVQRRQDPLYNTYTTKAIAFATFGLAFQFSGNTLTTWLAIEMIVLMISSRRSGFVITRILAHGVAFITVVHGVVSILVLMDFVPYDDPNYASILIRSLIPVVGFGILSQLYERTDWNSRMRLGLHIPSAIRNIAWRLDLASNEEAGETEEWMNGRLFPYLYSSVSGVLFLGYSLRVIAMDDRFNVFALVAAGLLILGWALSARPFIATSLAYVGLAWIMTFHSMLDEEFSSFYIFGVIGLTLCALATEKRLVPRRNSLALLDARVVPYCLYGVALWTISLYLTHYFEEQRYILALLVLCVVCAGVMRVLHERALALCATAILFCAHLIWHIKYLDLGESFGGSTDARGLANFVALLIIALGVVGDRLAVRRGLLPFGAVNLFVVFATGLHFINYNSSSAWFGFATAVMSGCFLVYTVAFRSRVAAGFALLSVLIASSIHTVWAYDSGVDMSTMATVIGFLASISLWMTFERLNSLYDAESYKEIRNWFTVGCVGAAAGLSVIMLERIPALSDLYLTVSWSLLGVFFFAAALLSSQKRYRYAGLAILALATFRVVVFDTITLDPVSRVLAFGGLGVILLGLAFGYSKAFGLESPSGLNPVKDE